jgi:hypothetical protein
MSDLASLIKSFEEAIVEAKAERERACELFYCYFILALFLSNISDNLEHERIQLEQIKQFGMNASES